MIKFLNKTFFFYVLKFLVIFCLFYFGTLAIIGLSSPSGYYSPFVAHYFNFIDGLRLSLLNTSKFFLELVGYKVYTIDKFTLRISEHVGIKMVYSCIGYGVMSFWGAFVIANTGTFKKKIIWLLCGWIAIWLINILRIVLLLIALYKGWQIPFGLDHHTWFNIAAYLLIFLLIYFYDRSASTVHQTHLSKNFK